MQVRSVSKLNDKDVLVWLLNKIIAQFTVQCKKVVEEYQVLTICHTKHQYVIYILDL